MAKPTTVKTGQIDPLRSYSSARSTEKAAKRLLDALDRLDEGCREPGFAGRENGNGEQVGDEAESARQALRALLK